MEMTTALYRHYDANGNLLYVGVSSCPVKRTYQHSLSSHWYNKIFQITIEWFETRSEAIEAEEAAIKNEEPLHNVMSKSGCLKEKNYRKESSIFERISICENVKTLDAFYDIDGVCKLLKLKQSDIFFLIESKHISCFIIKTARKSDKILISGWHILDYLESIKECEDK